MRRVCPSDISFINNIFSWYFLNGIQVIRIIVNCHWKLKISFFQNAGYTFLREFSRNNLHIFSGEMQLICLFEDSK